MLTPADLEKDISLLHSIIESLGEGVLVTDPEDRIIHANSMFSKLVGYPLEELVGEIGYQKFVDPADWDKIKKHNQQRMGGHSSYYVGRLVTRSGESRAFRVYAVPLKNCNGQIVGTIGSIIDHEYEEKLRQDNLILDAELKEIRDNRKIIGESPAVQFLHEQIERVAETDANVLILGESGTGKELVASTIHELSSRRSKRMVRVNCAAIPKDLFESEFFGHLKGAFTGAVKTRMGRFELAHESTLFLDEIGEIPLEMQGKLLRTIQEGTFERVGDDSTQKVNVRILAATNKNLAEEVKAGQFREDLYYRLNVFPIQVPPLRERSRDVRLLTDYFLKRISHRMGKVAPEISEQQQSRLLEYPWPGNIRELENVVERTLILHRAGEPLVFPISVPIPDSSESETISPSSTHTHSPTPSNYREFQDLEIKMLENALKDSEGKIHGRLGAAAKLGVKPTTLTSKLIKLGLK